MKRPDAPAAARAAAAAEPAAAEPDDAAVIAQILAGDRARFGVLVRRHNQRLYRAARAILGDDAEAEDAVQDAYVRAFHALAQYRGEAAFSTWLTRIAVHEAIARRRRSARLVALVDEEVAVDPERSPERAAADAELVRLVEREIDALPDGLRAVLVLRDLEELDTAATAATLALSEEAVRVRLHRARRALERAVGEAVGLAAPAAFRIQGARCDRIAARVAAALGYAPDDAP